MSYTVNEIRSTITIPKENLDEAWRRLDEGFLCGGKTASAEDFLQKYGFETEVESDGSLWFGGYYGKAYDEDGLLKALADLIVPGSFAAWVGEDGEIWADVFDGKEMQIEDPLERYEDMSREGLHQLQGNSEPELEER